MNAAPADAPARRRGLAFRHVAAAIMVTAAVGMTVALAAGGSSSAASRRELPAHPTIQIDGLRYEYDALRDYERLLDVSDPGKAPADVTSARAGDVLRLRARVLSDLGIDSLDVLRDAHREAADALRHLGYM